jgi:uncharacterized caspase-like protein
VENNKFASLVQIFLIAGIALFISGCKIQDKANRVAYVYGISLYNRSSTEGSSPNLSFTDNDAASMADLLKASGYTVYTRISGIAGDTPSTYPTRAQIESDIASIPAATERVVFYYSGHGFRNDYGSGIEDYIVPYGAYITGVVPSELIGATEMHRWLSACSVKQKILILDSCYSGGFVSTEGEIDLVPPIFGASDEYGQAPSPGILDPNLVSPILQRYMAGGDKPSDTLVLSAAGSMEASWEAQGHGIFTSALLDSVTPYAGYTGARADTDNDGVISVIEAFEYAAMAVDITWNQGAPYDASLLQYADYFPHVSSGSLDSILFSY